jgi:hypothetical protein
MAAQPKTPDEKHRDDVHTFWWHATFYVVVNAIIVAQDLIAGGGLDWAYWTFVPWGIGLLAHGLAVLFGRPRRKMGTV